MRDKIIELLLASDIKDKYDAEDKADEILALFGVVEQSEQLLCGFCKQQPIHEKYWLCKKCIDNYNREKQSTCQ